MPLVVLVKVLAETLLLFEYISRSIPMEVVVKLLPARLLLEDPYSQMPPKVLVKVLSEMLL